jgi:hypothetical protein
MCAYSSLNVFRCVHLQRGQRADTYPPYLVGTAGRQVGTKETLRSRFCKYTPAKGGKWLGPSEEIKKEEEKEKYLFFKEFQKRGFAMCYRWLKCPDGEPKALETSLLAAMDWAANCQENYGRRQLILPKALDDYPVVVEDD